jgi:hypothetical protein
MSALRMRFFRACPSLNRFSGKFLWLLMVVLVLLLLLPYLRSGYYGDDRWNLNFFGYAEFENKTFSQCIKDEILFWFRHGRIMWLAVLTTKWTVFPNLLIYRLYHVSLVLISVALGSLYFERITRTKNSKWVFALVLISLFQFREGQDPITSYAGLLQYVCIFGFLALILVERYRYEPSLLVGFSLSILLFCAISTYEVGFVFYSIAVLVLIVEKRYWLLLLNVLVLGCYLVSVALLRKNFETYVGIQPGFQIEKIAQTTYYQGISSIPLSYLFFGILEKRHAFVFFDWDIFVRAAIVSCFLYFCLVRLLLTVPSIRETRNFFQVAIYRRTIVLSLSSLLLLFVVPALLIGFSARYQTEVKIGIGYLPVYVSYFGVAGFLVYMLLLVKRVHWLQKLVIIVIAFVGGMHLYFNEIMRKRADFDVQASRRLMMGAIDSGIWNHVPQGALVVYEDCFFPYLYNKYFLYYETKRRFETKCGTRAEAAKEAMGRPLFFSTMDLKRGVFRLERLQGSLGGFLELVYLHGRAARRVEKFGASGRFAGREGMLLVSPWPADSR